MNYGIMLYPYQRWGGVGPMAEAVMSAEAMGFTHVAVGDHVVSPANATPDIGSVWYDAFVLASHLASLTSRIRLLVTAVVPYRHPLTLAKAVASLDVISGGRVTCLAASGWLAEEFAALDVPFEDRGARTDDYLRALQVVWTGDEPSYQGRFVSFPPVAFEPRGVQTPHVPLWIGGSGPATFRRVAELGDGWAPIDGSIEDLADGITSVERELARCGRAGERLRYATYLPVGGDDPTIATARRHVTGPAGGASPWRERAAQLAEIGFTDLTISFPWVSPREFADRLESFAGEAAVGHS